jgi:hypothetical protein
MSGACLQNRESIKLKIMLIIGKMWWSHFASHAVNVSGKTLSVVVDYWVFEWGRKKISFTY